MENTFEWKKETPEKHGMSESKLDLLRDILADRGTKTFLVVRHDKIIYEWYSPDFNSTKLHYTASLAKALVGGMSLTIALNDGLISIDDQACKYIPSWMGHTEKSKITIRHLTTHSSGIEDAEEDNLSHDQLTGWKGDFWKQEPDPFSIAKDQAPIIFSPGTRYAYSNPGMAMLAYAVTASIKQDIRSLLRDRIMRPIGVSDSEWSVSYGKIYELAGLKLCANWGGGNYTARAVASVGRLMLKKGNWEGRQLIAPEWIEKTVAYAGTPLPDRSSGEPAPASGLGWWTNFDGVWKSLPRDAFAGAGAGNQILLVIPSLDMIVVRNGSGLGNTSKGEGFWSGLDKYLFNPLMEALNEKPTGVSSYPASPVISGVKWSDNIIRLATGKNGDGSDNFPVTWTDDDNLYTAYGDGYGFDPVVPNKLGLGFGRIIGDPPDIAGENIRSDAENNGMGRSGKKASGLLMVDGILYMWARNADNDGKYCQLAWSDDHAKTWTWCEWKFEEFGYLTFVNFGKNYTGVSEKYGSYVYMVTHDNPSAYEPADHFVLLRVPKDKITDHESYEFFKGLDSQNEPIWTSDITKRGAVFENSGKCLRSGISYNAGLNRFLWWQQIPDEGVDTRFKGGFGIYDAPDLWGTWTTVYYTKNWDTGPGETASFPTKWMSSDGKVCHLVFSGNDNFSVRKVTFDIAR